MGNNMIIVFTKEERDMLVKNGFALINNDEDQDLYTFYIGDDDPESIGVKEFALTKQVSFGLERKLV